jgi:hypothetical protein
MRVRRFRQAEKEGFFFVTTSLARLDDALDKALYQPPDKEKPLLLRLAEATDAHGPVAVSARLHVRCGQVSSNDVKSNVGSMPSA